MKRISLRRISLAAMVAGALAVPAAAQEDAVTDVHKPDPATSEQLFKEPGYSPYAGRNFPTRVFWGNQHMHTAVSLDAGAIGCKLGPEEAYRLARGEEVTTSTGQAIKLSRPMDWLLVSDHAEAIGAIAGIIGDNPALMADPTVKRWHDMIKAGGKNAFDAAWEMIRAMGAHKIPPVLTDRAFLKTIWDKQIQIAEKYNEPGRFTAFLGYEWTSMPGGDNIHRNVVFRDGADKAGQVLPFSALDSENPEDLWKVLASYEEKTSGQVLAIPHNPNISGGRMFEVEDFTGNPFTAAYAEARARWEPLLEVVQVKGDSESHPFLSPTDEFSGYAAWDKMNLGATKLHQDEWFKSEYAREALKTGLKLEQDLGTNPFKFGLVGGTDQHIGITAIEEENYFGQTPMDEPKAERALGEFSHINDVKVMNWEEGAAGYAAVWATDNTRAALWDAMKRKEVYATTGSRMIVRLFGGWDFEPNDAQSRLPAETGYNKGVPMGGDLRAAPDSKAPTFLVAALKDPIGANLDRIQIIKGWLDAKGETQEKIYDVAWGDADTRQPGADGKLPPVGNTVDVANATWTNTIGDPELIAVWKDPDFDPKLKALTILV